MKQEKRQVLLLINRKKRVWRK